ncbi:MAG: TauD/TfdA family dioxygenase [Gammaproteobacteria bacterium]|jgi:alpha-ketoglutarate-dependent taurine dioxygenase
MTVPLTRSDNRRVAPGPFDLEASRHYSAWRDRKLADYPLRPTDLMVSVADPAALSDAERCAILDALRKTNVALYQVAAEHAADKHLMRCFGRQFGLERLDSNLCADEDGITALQVVEKRGEGEYIPYSNLRLNWHTDGYYNSLDRQIRGIVLQCVRPAASGGESAFVDHEIAYILLRDANPDYIRALMAPDAMTIPPNVQNGVELRPEQTGPVFSVDGAGNLHMRYSARGRNIVWKDNADTRAAAGFLLNLFQQDSPYILRHRLEAGQGVISNNALHCRAAFSNDVGSGRERLLYRARYFDRIADNSGGG